MFRFKISMALGLLVALVCVQAAFVYMGSVRVYDYAQHSRLASDIMAELVDLSANKQRLRVWALQRLMNAAEASPETRIALLAQMRASATTLQDLARRDQELLEKLSGQSMVEPPADGQRLVAIADLLDDDIVAMQHRLLELAPLTTGSDFGAVWQELDGVFNPARVRNLRDLVDSAIKRQRQVVPAARAVTASMLDALRMQAIGMAAVTLLASIVMARWLGSHLQQPLARLMTGIRQLQAGQLDHRVRIESEDEFAKVAEQFNAMTDELQQHRTRADATRQQLEAAVQDRTAELRQAHETLQRIDERRRQLFADLSHDLRTPATAIRGEAEIALRGADRPVAEYRQTLSRIVDGVGQLSDVVDDLMLVARADADQLILRPAPVELLPLVQEAVEQAGVLGAARRVRVCLEFPENAMSASIRLHADEDRLRRALMVVLDNAERYSHEGGTVRVRCSRDGDRARVTVQDEGIGIDTDEMPLVFERFVRGRRARLHRADGSGIGLSIANAIVTGHGGTISIASQRDAGTAVHIVLPLAGAATVPSASDADA
ncbi:sensor histidine kinase [Xylophilus ampelinus]|uniref:histidine kinase n=1 Tax=Xylophilus ampelinus TaxID=54067 RepID=A0A318SG19_9BURK|nr:HAMP domain-containing sensor histidine kinase [Xylophilus ampelinus]MCS4510590.1 ATP-binding protein [Xylophilus ampelinus]PYE77783.1 phospho-acceptor domain-containing protein [Xylophilus ampelinus]